MKYLSLFSGIGGFEYGICNAFRNTLGGIQADPQRDEVKGQGLESTSRQDADTQNGWSGSGTANLINTRPHCIGFSEIDKYATAIYKYHYPDHKELGNARDIICESLPDFDLLVGGFPCQTFSIAGKRAGFDDIRGTLFFEIARILRDKRPRYTVLENVEGLLSHDDGKTFYTILRILADIGYRVQWQVLNSKFFGVPQNRPRVFIVGYFGEGRGRKVFPLRESDGISKSKSDSQQREKQRICSTIDSRYGALRNAGETYVGTLRTHKDGQGFRQIKDGNCPAIPARAREDGSGQPVIWQRAHGYNNGGVKEMPCLRSSSMEHNDFLLENAQFRRLTPLECERLQGFPDDWTKYGAYLPKINKNKCAKQTTIAIIENKGKFWVGQNWCKKPQKVCPRKGLPTGEGYELCKEVCQQSNHAEMDALLKAGSNANGGYLYLIGHTYCCQNCLDNMKKFGIKDYVIGKYPSIEISDTQRYKCCGNAVTTKVITEIINLIFN